MTRLALPVGMDAVRSVFGYPDVFKAPSAAWETHILALRPLNTPLIYAASGVASITRVRAHHMLVDHLVETLTACQAAGVTESRLKYGGCYAWRAKRGMNDLSLHCWGIAVDLEPQENPLGVPWTDDGKMLDPRIITTFKDNGWFWGGDFKGRADCQHFQWASGV